MEFDDFIMEKQKKNYIQQLIEHNLKILLIGEKETGKTDLIKRVINYASSQQNIKTLIIKNYNDISIHYFRNEVKQFCQTSKNITKLIVIDDLDYIKESSQHILCCLMNKYENVNYIFSCKNIRKINDNIINKSITIILELLNKDELFIILERFVKKNNMIISNESKEYIVNNSEACPLLLKNNLKCLLLYDSVIDIDITRAICNKSQNINYNKYFELLRDSKKIEAVKVLIEINENCVSLLDMFDMLYNYVKSCDYIFTETEKYNIIKIISKYKIILNVHHENDIELNFITSDIYYELQKDI
tara:strand:- start:3012 stop:3920 length:909 start_codon:yes stop_codon:yes gene_type:complete